MIGNDVFTEHSDYKWFRLECFRNSRNSICSPNKKGHRCGGPLAYSLFLWYRKIFTLLVVGCPRIVLAP